MHSQRKMGFWSVSSLVIGSQIGSGIFLLPASLGAFGAIGLASWLITATGAILLALVFARLCTRFAKTGGPHVYVEAAFGKTAAFYCAWTYWVISWVSTTAVLIAIVGYLSPIFGVMSSFVTIVLEIAVLVLIVSINMLGVKKAGQVEFVFTLLKILPLLIVPIAGLWFLNTDHFKPFNPTEYTTLDALNAAALFTLWGFIGVESATTPAGSVDNPQKTIPRAIVFGTLLVAFVYMFSTFVIIGVLPSSVLTHSAAPFSDAASIIFGGNWHIFVSLAGAIVCIGTLNAWVLTSSQIALGAANDGHFPAIFGLKNKNNVPMWSLVISSAGILPVLFLTLDVNLISQVNTIIDVSVTAFLLVYLVCILSYLKLWVADWHAKKSKIIECCIGIFALIFCGWALWASGFKMVFFAALITSTGIPIYLWKHNKPSELYYQDTPDRL
jgi:APA family basic amino acid/polyamine antiporter